MREKHLKASWINDCVSKIQRTQTMYRILESSKKLSILYILTKLFRLSFTTFSTFSIIFIVFTLLFVCHKHYVNSARSKAKDVKNTAQKKCCSRKKIHYVAQLIFKSNQLGFTLHIKNKLKSSFRRNKCELWTHQIEVIASRLRCARFRLS